MPGAVAAAKFNLPFPVFACVGRALSGRFSFVHATFPA